MLLSCQSLRRESIFTKRDIASSPCPRVQSGNLEDMMNVIAQFVNKNQTLSSDKPLYVKKYQGKVVVFRFIGSWCPWCKYDIETFYDNFDQEMKDGRVQLVLIAISDQRENESTVKVFRDKIATSWKLNPDFFDLWFVPTDSFKRNGFQRMSTLRDSNGQFLFPNMKGVPYSIVYDAQGNFIFIIKS
jgi:thiol-disulfide isomerase/thioredoxin